MRRPEPHPTDTFGRQLIRVLAVIVFVLGAVFVGGTAAAVIYLERNPPPLSAFMWISRTSDPSTDLPCDEVLYEWVDRDRISPHLRLAVVLAESDPLPRVTRRGPCAPARALVLIDGTVH